MPGLKVPLKYNPKSFASLWIIFIFLTIFSFFTLTKWSFFKLDAVVIWLFSCIAILLLSQKMPFHKTKRNDFMIILGIILIIYSFFNIPIGFGNPPYSIGDFSLLLSGLGLVFFGIKGFKTFFLPVLLPAIGVIGFQFYDRFTYYLDWISRPIIPLIVEAAIFFLRILGVDFISEGNSISYFSLHGDSVNLLVTENCTGIWSLGTFTITCLIILASFPQARSSKSYLLIFIGFLGTIFSNILRIWLIIIVGLYWGSFAAIKVTHDYFGWLIFTFWVILFWYVFITRHLNISIIEKIRNQKTGTSDDP